MPVPLAPRKWLHGDLFCWNQGQSALVRRGFKGTNDGFPDIFRNWLRFQEIIDLVVGYTVRIFIRALGSDRLKIGRGHFEDEIPGGAKEFTDRSDAAFIQTGQRQDVGGDLCR